MHDWPPLVEALDDLIALSPEARMPMLRAVVGGSEGAVLLGEGSAREALDGFVRRGRSGTTRFPYEAARCRVLVARRAAHRRRGIRIDGFDAARTGSPTRRGTDLARLDELARSSANPLRPADRARGRGGRLVAAGKTNRAIANELYLAEKTVDAISATCSSSSGSGRGPP